MINSFGFKQRLFLIFFTILMGSHIHIFQEEIQFHLNQLVQTKTLSGEVKFSINKFSIEFLIQLITSFVCGAVVIPIWFKNIRFTSRTRAMLSLFLFIPIASFADQFFLERFMLESIFLSNFVTKLYFTSLFLVAGFYILPKFISLSEYQPGKALKGGILACAFIMPFALVYDTISEHYPFFITYLLDDSLKNSTQENYIYYFIGYLIHHYTTLETYISSYGMIWFSVSFFASGISAWFAYFIIYQSNLKNWQKEVTVFE
ncbi:hypothetical protein WH96_04735 [Kiloniella spongiae]|uniref:Uncharacterized protein n=1 Tax=Kiloniella spongiae TaxID=1489064 RepID=A0A0H2MGX7_9PROT|nr:hypothetical protein [Kiloniella spongiae]KLN61648.1 hypothetical protein WH96_04735 [Kiloniella spongiae]